MKGWMFCLFFLKQTWEHLQAAAQIPEGTLKPQQGARTICHCLPESQNTLGQNHLVELCCCHSSPEFTSELQNMDIYVPAVPEQPSSSKLGCFHIRHREEPMSQWFYQQNLDLISKQKLWEGQIVQKKERSQQTRSVMCTHLKTKFNIFHRLFGD